MKYLDLTAEQAAELAVGQVVEVWERMEPQPTGPCQTRWDGRTFAHWDHTHPEDAARIPAPHPPRTRAIAGMEPGDIEELSVEYPIVSTTTRPEQRDGVWGFVTGWVQA